MPVRHADRVLNDYLAAYLDERVPADYMATYSVAPVTKDVESHCDEHNEDHVEEVICWQVNVHMVKVGRTDADPPGMNMHALLPFGSMADGDTEPLRQIMDTLWSEYSFVSLVHPIDGEIEQSAQEPEG